MALECGECTACLNMKKNGGPGTMRQSCFLRKCHNMLAGKPGGGNALAPFRNVMSSNPPVGREYVSGLWRDGHGQLVNYTTPGRCAVCDGKRDAECARLDEPTILCDGCYCSREFHLKCSGLDSVPESEFFCFNCCPMGASRGLNTYFEGCESARSVCGSSDNFVRKRAREILGGGGLGTMKVNKFMTQLGKGGRFVSEISDFVAGKEGALAELVGELMMEDENQDEDKDHKDSEGQAGTTSPTSLALSPPLPSSTLKLSNSTNYGDNFLGQSVRLYCPEDNTYHVGRIISFRKHARPYVATTNPVARPSQEEILNNCQPPESFFGHGGHMELEFLVRFRSGTEGRKVPVHRWIVFEEHALAVTCAVVWGRVKGNPWWPAQTVYRSCLEVLHGFISKHFDGVEIDGGVGSDEVGKQHKQHKSHALFFGEQTNCTLDLVNDATNFLSPRFATKRATVDSLLCISVAMAQVELEEQRRIRTWFALKSQEGDDGVTAIMAANSALQGWDSETRMISNNDPDIEDELKSRGAREAVVTSFNDEAKKRVKKGRRAARNDDDDDDNEGWGGGERDKQKEKGKGKAVFPSVPPVPSPLVSDGVRSEILAAMTEGGDEGGESVGTRKRKKIKDVELVPVNSETMRTLKEARKGKK